MASVDVQPQPVAQSKANIFGKDSVLRSLLLSLLLLAATIVVYAPVHDHPFANIDDPKYVTQNPHIQNGLTPASVFWAFTHGYAGNYHPLTWVSHALDIQMFGLDPTGHHDENVLLHAINAVLLFWVLKRATGYTWRSLMVAALFALHPLNVESVAWIAERKTMLSTLFCLLALAAYQWYAARPGIVRYTVMTTLFIFGLWSKPQIIMLPLVLLLWDYWPLGRTDFRSSLFAFRQRRDADISGEERTTNREQRKTEWRLVLEKFPLFFICLVDAGVTMIAQHVTGGDSGWPLWVRLENAVVSYTRYIRKAFWPTNMALYYPHPGRTLHFWQWGTACLVLAAITVWVWRERRQRYLLVGWLWFLIMLIPMIGIVQADVQGMADRYAYVSFIGLFLMVCWGVGDWAAALHLPAAVVPAISIAALVALSLVTRHQLGYWADNISLWSHSAQVTERNWKAEYTWGESLEADGQHDAAVQHYLIASKWEWHDPFIEGAIASYEHTHGNFPMALEYYNRALADAWNSDQRAATLQNMAALYRMMGDTEKANECLAKIHTLPQRKVDWQGNWWDQILPQIMRWLHGGKTQG